MNENGAQSLLDAIETWHIEESKQGTRLPRYITARQIYSLKDGLRRQDIMAPMLRYSDITCFINICCKRLAKF
jgi:hypothetical protein